MAASGPRVLVLDGESLTPEDVYSFSRDTNLHIALDDAAWQRVDDSRRVVDSILDDGKVAYGINTGFGNFASVVLPNEKLTELQENLIRSHAAGVGAPLSWQRTRMFLGLRINVLAKGHSGIRRVTIEKMIRAFNACCLSYIPDKGTVGASGDLAPLSHLALGLMGEGEMWNPTSCAYEPAAAVLAAHGLEPIELKAKEGLALINGAQFITCLACEAYVRAKRLVFQGSVVAAVSMEALRGVTTAFDKRIGEARPHEGLVRVARHMRTLLHSESNRSEIYESCPHNVQDAYSMRCIPQVHGAVLDMLEFVGSLLETECNSGTDNPMVFGTDIISGGNFHGEYPAKAADYLAVAISELASISERRIERMMNKSLNGPSVISDKDPNAPNAARYHLPAFLVEPGLQGLCSGFMIAHCTAAALVSENKVLVHPASADSITTSAGQEDHVSMGGFAARKAIAVVEHSEHVLAIELLCAVQALDFLLPLKPTAPLQRVYAHVRAAMPTFTKDEYMKPHLDRLAEVVRQSDLWEVAMGSRPEDL